MADEGYIAISRKLFSNPIWTDKREFSRAEAWIDLIQTAAWKDGNRLLIEGQMISWDRGQIAASVRFLKTRWGWASNGKITRFLKMLSDERMIFVNTEQAVSIITLCKYDDYNITIGVNGTQTEQERNADGTQTEQIKVIKIKKVSIKASMDLLRQQYEDINPKDLKSISKFISETKPQFSAPYLDMWNAFASSVEPRLPQVQKLSGVKRGKLATRLKEPEFDFVVILRKAIKQQMLMQSSWFNFDWLIYNDDNYTKILSENYHGSKTDIGSKSTIATETFNQPKNLAN